MAENSITFRGLVTSVGRIVSPQNDPQNLGGFLISVSAVPGDKQDKFWPESNGAPINLPVRDASLFMMDDIIEFTCKKVDK